MKGAKKHALSLLMLGMALVLPVVSAHAFLSVSKSTNTAQAVLTGVGTVAMNLFIKLNATNVIDTAVNWTGVTLPTQWQGAADYIELHSTTTASGSGVQMYTDNMNVSASPRFTGDNTQVSPAGLVDGTTTVYTLPVAWAIRDALVGGTTGPIVAEPNDSATNPESYQWHYLSDAGQVAIASLNVSAFANADPYITVVSPSGIHWGQGPTQFGAAASPNYIYFEAQFGSAQTPRTYSTNRLMLESYTQ